MSDEKAIEAGDKEFAIHGGLPSESTSSLPSSANGSKELLAAGAHNRHIDGEIQKLARAQSTASSENFSYVNPFNTDNRPELNPTSGSFSAEAWVKNLMAFWRSDPDRHPQLSSDVSFRNLKVYGFRSASDHQTDLMNYPLNLAKRMVRDSQKVQILHGFDGLVRKGEMLLVLGRPGSGCTTLLKSIAGDMHGLRFDPASEINFQGIDWQTMHTRFRGECSYQAEFDAHFPSLTVGQTLEFAALARTPHNRPDSVSRAQYAQHLRDVFVTVFGLSRSVDTRVGNDLIRGVSGGERKRVSLAEAALCGSAIQCWDNSTRGLDSSTALEFIQTLRRSADYLDITPFVTIYQASEASYNLFDKVTVLYEGRQIYFGPTTEAKQFFYDLGFECPERQTTADYLASITNPGERIYRPGFEDKAPRTPDEFAAAWTKSPQHAELMAQIAAMNEKNPVGQDRTAHFDTVRQMQKSEHNRQKSPYTLSYRKQINLCLQREWRILRADLSALISNIMANTIMALIFSSIFFDLPANSASFYRRSSLIFYSLLLGATASSMEILSLYVKRPIVEKHLRFALYHPSAEAIASMISDLPNKIVTSICFNSTIYFMTNLRRTPEAFFTYLLFSFSCTMAMSMIFRFIGGASRSLSQALVPAAVFILAIIIYAGFALPTRDMPPWLRWFNYINPIAYGFEAMVINEFRKRVFPCSAYIPSGDDYASVDSANKVCSVTGSIAGEDVVSGEGYILTSFKYHTSHLWRNLGIIWAFVVVGLFVNLITSEMIRAKRLRGDVLIFHRPGNSSIRQIVTGFWRDEEKGPVNAVDQGSIQNTSDSDSTAVDSSLVRKSGESVFQWDSICYDIKVKGGKQRRLLNDVEGWVKGGTITALMGASGAGKTTLLDTLANRINSGTVSGEILVNGQLPNRSFQRKTGYAQQQDIHLSTSTVREALIFSALLRQPKSTPYEEKMAYVDEVLGLLDLASIADAIVGIPGEGLNIEQRKRLTIGVELVAKPDLLFLDEPTSGLDSQTAWSILMLLRKLANNGKSILCTIHQPSAMLFQMFDRLLVLSTGGRPAYFGDIGENSETLISYFERNGSRHCGSKENPAEWMMDVIGADASAVVDKNWAEVWQTSPERDLVKQTLTEMKEQLSGGPANSSADSMDEYATSTWEQTVAVTGRILQQYWRSPTYVYSKVLLCMLSSLFIGISFWRSPRSIQGLQNQMLSAFLLLSVFSNLAEQMMPQFVAQRALYEARERPSKSYSWKVFIFSNIAVEALWNSLVAVFIFVCWYYPTGMNRNATGSATAERGFLMFFFMWQFLLFATSLIFACITGIEAVEAGANICNLFFSVSMMFCGVLAPPSTLPGFWTWMSKLSPCTYLVDGILSVGVGRSRITCSDIEFQHFSPPANQTCAEYMSSYITRVGGYLDNPTSTTSCSFCQLNQTDDYLKTIGYSYEKRWRNSGIIWAYIIFNSVLAVFMYWLARVPKGAETPGKRALAKKMQ